MLNPRTLALKLEFHLFKKEGALLQKVFPKKWQTGLRRRMRAKYLLWDARHYHAWLKQQLAERKTRYEGTLENGLLSLLTPVWDGTPLKYFRLLAESVIQQNAAGAAEWVILDNGCQNKELLAFLAKLEKYGWIRVTHSATNVGIIGGLRLCLEAATGRYVLPVDSDDWLYPDCLQIVTWWIRQKDFPPLLYTDEDKVIGPSAVQPYLKPAFDPVLLLNSAYIAHLGVIDRKLALAHNAYADKSTEGSPDWDLFTRFLVAGLNAVHVPEVVYSWRMHPESTADDAASKPYIHSSQKAVLQRYIDVSGLADRFEVVYSPLLKGSCDWWLRRRPVNPRRAMLVSLNTDAAAVEQIVNYPHLKRLSLPKEATVKDLVDLVAVAAQSENELVCLVADDLAIDRGDWIWEALGLFERYPDMVMVGGRIYDRTGLILSGGYVLGFGNGCECPDRGRPAVDPGYFTQMLKQRSVSAVTSQFSVLQAGTLSDMAKSVPDNTSLAMLGPWVGAWALRKGKRVIYSPYLSGVSKIDWDALPKSSEVAAFQRSNSDLLPDHRYYPAAFEIRAAKPYRFRF